MFLEPCAFPGSQGAEALSGLPLQSVIVCMGNATAASLGMGAAHAMEATQAPGVTKVNTLVPAEGLGEQTSDMDLGVPKGAGKH